MAKDTFYFSHDYNARNDEKVLELRANYGAEGYGVFWMIVESMAENENGGVKASLIGGLSVGFGIDREKLNSIIALCLKVELLYEKDGFYFSKRLLIHKEQRGFYAEKGREGAKKRWENRGAIMEANKVAIAGLMQRKEKENKEKEIVGIKFEENMVVFSDGSKQELGLSQRQKLREGSYKPHYVKKGIIE